MRALDERRVRAQTFHVCEASERTPIVAFAFFYLRLLDSSNKLR